MKKSLEMPNSISIAIRVQKEIGIYGSNINQILPEESNLISGVLTRISSYRHQVPAETLCSMETDLQWLHRTGRLGSREFSEQLNALEPMKRYVEMMEPPRLDQMVEEGKIPAFLAPPIDKVLHLRPRAEIQEVIDSFLTTLPVTYTDSIVRRPETVVDTVHAMVPLGMTDLRDQLDLGFSAYDVAVSTRLISRAVDLGYLEGGKSFSTLLVMLQQYDLAQVREEHLRSEKEAIKYGRNGLLLTPVGMAASVGFVLASWSANISTESHITAAGFGTVLFLMSGLAGMEGYFGIRQVGLKKLLPQGRRILPGRRPLKKVFPD